MVGTVNPLARMVWDRCAPRRFTPDDVPDEDLQTMLTLATQAPSGFNLQPWRFVVVRDQAQRDRLRRAAQDHAVVAEAPVVVVAYGRRSAWDEHAAEISELAVAREVWDARRAGQLQEGASAFVRTQDIAVWLHRHVMVAFTYLMIAAEAFGWDTVPMEGFEPREVCEVLALPDDAEVVALLAIGRLCDPDPVEPGRLPLEKLVYAEHAGCPWRDPLAALD